MPYKYIGRKTDFKGKTLWEIVGNLKNFGVGRLVARNMVLERYPELSYMKILKVETLPEPKEKSLDNPRKVKVLVERVFRGRTFPKPIYIESTSYKSDYLLIPKDEEYKFYKDQSQGYAKEFSEKILPRTTTFPPLMRELLKREMKMKGEPVSEPMMEIVYNLKKKSWRIAEEGEEPTVKYDSGLGKPSTLSLYKGIKL